MSWVFVVIVAADFLVYPAILGLIFKDATLLANWNPLTLKGGGIFYMAMSVFLGVYAWGRTMEKRQEMEIEPAPGPETPAFPTIPPLPDLKPSTQ